MAASLCTTGSIEYRERLLRYKLFDSLQRRHGPPLLLAIPILLVGVRSISLLVPGLFAWEMVDVLMVGFAMTFALPWLG